MRRRLEIDGEQNRNLPGGKIMPAVPHEAKRNVMPKVQRL
jgi:hypothetical protein